MLISFLLVLTACTTEDPTFGNVPMGSGQDQDDLPPLDTDETQPDTDEPVVDTGDVGTPCEGKPTGTDIGLCAENFTLQDKDGQMVSLYDFYGDVIYLDLSAYT